MPVTPALGASPLAKVGEGDTVGVVAAGVDVGWTVLVGRGVAVTAVVGSTVTVGRVVAVGANVGAGAGTTVVVGAGGAQAASTNITRSEQVITSFNTHLLKLVQSLFKTT